MFVRYVRNRQSQKRHGNSAANVVALILFGVIFVSFFDIISLYNFIIASEYSAFLYGKSEGESNRNATASIVEAINRQSNLYAYIEENSTEISLTYYDPSYTTKQFGGTMVVDKENSTDETETWEETTGEPSQSQMVSTGDNDIKTGQDSGYIIPAVSEAGIVYSMEQLSDFDFLMSKMYTVPKRAKVLESDLVASEMLASDMSLKGDNSKPQILIYHTHSQEGFVDSVQGDDSTSIVAVGTYLAKILSEVYGYNVIHCTEHFDIKGGSLDRSKAYTYAEYTVEQILEDNPSIEVVLDIHRDGLKEGADKLVTNINGKDTAKIMFFNGVSRSSESGDIDYLYNRYRKENLAFSFQLKLMALQCYPEFTRRNYIDAYQYNMHLRPKSVLVEVGAQNNTLQEELNAMEVLAEVLHRVIK